MHLQAARCYKCGTDLQLDEDTLVALRSPGAPSLPTGNAEAQSYAGGHTASQTSTGNPSGSVLPIRSLPIPAPWRGDQIRKRIEVAQQEYQTVLAESLSEEKYCGSISESTQQAVNVLKAEITALGNGAAAPIPDLLGDDAQLKSLHVEEARLGELVKEATTTMQNAKTECLHRLASVKYEVRSNKYQIKACKDRIRMRDKKAECSAARNSTANGDSNATVADAAAQVSTAIAAAKAEIGESPEEASQDNLASWAKRLFQFSSPPPPPSPVTPPVTTLPTKEDKTRKASRLDEPEEDCYQWQDEQASREAWSEAASEFDAFQPATPYPDSKNAAVHFQYGSDHGICVDSDDGHGDSSSDDQSDMEADDGDPRHHQRSAADAVKARDACVPHSIGWRYHEYQQLLQNTYYLLAEITLRDEAEAPVPANEALKAMWKTAKERRSLDAGLHNKTVEQYAQAFREVGDDAQFPKAVVPTGDSLKDFTKKWLAERMAAQDPAANFSASPADPSPVTQAKPATAAKESS